MKVVPCPGVLSTVTCPPCALTDLPPAIMTDTPENEGIRRFFAL